jgi:hypothetical protein
MIVGADVTHPSPDQTDIPSVAAVSMLCYENNRFLVMSFALVNILLKIISKTLKNNR